MDFMATLFMTTKMGSCNRDGLDVVSQIPDRMLHLPLYPLKGT